MGNRVEVTLGDSDRSQGKEIYKTAMAWSDNIFKSWSHIYNIRNWADYRLGILSTSFHYRYVE